MATTSDTLRTPCERPTRRGLLTGIATASVLGSAAVAPMAAASEVDPHTEWWRQSVRIRTRINTEDLSDPVCDVVSGEMYALDDLIAETPAETLAGLCAQLRLAHYCAETWEGDRNEPVEMVLRNAIATLERLSGASVPA